ncbi:MAG: transglycosylase domain-containing protein, partial [Calditrichaeota bacterium]|nr:transglycosylase domain-containing protein [Calditrichota bacterium]
MSKFFRSNPDDEPEYLRNQEIEEIPEGSGGRMKWWLTGIGVLFLIFVAGLLYLLKDIPDFKALENVNPAQATRLYSTDGKVIEELFILNRIWTSIDQIPLAVREAAVATEDRQFRDHWGVNLKAFPRAVLVNLRDMGFSQGFSTITMQVARNLFNREIGFDRSVLRKLREIVTAINIERTYSKNEILEMYLNLSYFGRGSYGIKSAARKYFDKDVSELTVGEGCYLVGVLKGPAYYDPWNSRLPQNFDFESGMDFFQLHHLPLEKVRERLDSDAEVYSFIDAHLRAWVENIISGLASQKEYLDIADRITGSIDRESGSRKRNGVVDVFLPEYMRTFTDHEVSAAPADVDAAVDRLVAADEIRNKDIPRIKNALAEAVNIVKGDLNRVRKMYVEYCRAKNRRNTVIDNLVVTGKWSELAISDPASQDAEAVKPRGLGTRKYNRNSGVSPYFTEYIRQQLERMEETYKFNIYEDGLKVFTTLDSRVQTAMDSAIAQQLPTIDERMVSVTNKWREENPEIEDSVFEALSVLQVAAVALDHQTGHILAMVGGRDFNVYKFNRAVQAKRQPGSTFKPFLYAAAIDNGYKPSDKLLNQPIVITNPDGTRWTPENFDRTFGGLTPLREGLRRSLNLIASRLILEIGPQVVVDYARNMGLTTSLRPFPSLAMGSSSVIPIEMVSAFGVFANGGVLVEPFGIERIEDRYGNLIFQGSTKRSEALNRSTAYIMTDMMETAINAGTGASARYKWGFTAPAAGKTG